MNTIQQQSRIKKFWTTLHIDIPLFISLFILTILGLFILYSASNQNIVVIYQQTTRLLFSAAIMLILAQIPPHHYKRWSPWIFTLGLTLLTAVLVIGVTTKGAQRWLNLGAIKFQPSELMKLAVPMMLAWFLTDKRLPPKFNHVTICLILMAAPILIIAKQPDLGTAFIIASAGIAVLILAGINWRLVSGFCISAIITLPILWHFMHDYQRSRILTFFNPERDPLGSGYHIIQSKIAIGSGGLFGKGWLNGTQTHLHFLPEHSTDFIFALCGEELGFIGCIALLGILLFIVFRSLYISSKAQDTYTRLLAGSLALMFFMSFFINIGMVTGILPVVGLPLPLVSYGGTSMVTIMAGFGIIMSIHTHRKLLTS